MLNVNEKQAGASLPKTCVKAERPVLRPESRDEWKEMRRSISSIREQLDLYSLYKSSAYPRIVKNKEAQSKDRRSKSFVSLGKSPVTATSRRKRTAQKNSRSPAQREIAADLHRYRQRRKSQLVSSQQHKY